MRFSLQKLLTARGLSPDAESYFLGEYSKHTIVLVAPAIVASVTLVLFALQRNQTSWLWAWLAIMVAMQIARFYIATLSLSDQSKYQRSFALLDYLSPIGLLFFF